MGDENHIALIVLGKSIKHSQQDRSVPLAGSVLCSVRFCFNVPYKLRPSSPSLDRKDSTSPK